MNAHDFSVRRQQQGLSLVGVLIVASFAGFFLLLGFRSVPAINEYLAVKRIVKTLAEEGSNGATITELRRSFDTRGQIDDISSISGTDLDIYKQGGTVVVEVSYSRKVPVAGNVSLLFDFDASSRTGL